MGRGQKGERGSRTDRREDGQLVLGANLFLACEIGSSASDGTVAGTPYRRPMPVKSGPQALTTGAARHRRVSSRFRAGEVIQANPCAALERRAVHSDRSLRVPMKSDPF